MEKQVHTTWTDAVEKRVSPEAYLKMGGLIANAFDRAGLHLPGGFDISIPPHEDYPECDLVAPHKHILATHPGYTRDEHEQFMAEYEEMVDSGVIDGHPNP